ncbi:MAG: dephospho-CoA kinase [Aphanocapsa feldmannii 277cV]|uniref:Dephospho-CoA kinase n=2 Tax=Aphanocapsa feldmannii TaxID=192050 RepID=A0A524RRH3_9CHRO|nr:MAG: dephospho-CoA kinase [Aphanocapsa feldmannii 288cV]TGG94824.1 MAG: dephospho-CoA kinase [Aphanocapsa feldmannii 277cV]TGH19522.1 MAG: dephospho-CoA kinase [Aphanocapsa feldmannii 277cI]
MTEGRSRWPGPQRRIGVSGGIASGKSTVTALLSRRHGFPVLDADVMARAALAPDSPLTPLVLQHFGTRIEDAGGQLDRKALGRIVFSDVEARAWLEARIHPLVRQGFDQALAHLAHAPTVVLAIPLLFEAGLEALCSEIWLLDLPEVSQLQRLRQRSAISGEEARARIAAQWPSSRKRPLADRILDNSGDREALERQVDKAVEAISPAAATAARLARPPGTVHGVACAAHAERE